MTGCIKKLGEKTEEIKSKTEEIKSIARLPPTPNDNVIVHQDVLLLQFAYSDEFACIGGAFIGNLFRKFAFVFGLSIDSESLRQATLACAAAFNASNGSFDRMQEHSMAASKAFRAKSSDTLEMADLYAALLLAYLSCLYEDSRSFAIHMEEVGEIIQNRKAMQSAKNHPRLFIFLPLARDLILEASRTVRFSNPVVLQFCNDYQQAIGPPDFENRTQYFQEVVSVREQHFYAFYHSIWHHTTTLRHCLRDTVWRQVGAVRGLNPYVETVLNGVKLDLESTQVQAIVAQLSLLKSVPAGKEEQHYIMHGEWMFSLLLYHFCMLMIAVLETESLIQGVSSIPVVSRANGLLQFVDNIWFQDEPFIPCNFGVPSDLRKPLVVRILLLIGLTMKPEQFRHGKSTRAYALIVGAESIVKLLESSDEVLAARRLEEFWKHPNAQKLLNVMDVIYARKHSFLW